MTAVLLNWTSGATYLLLGVLFTFICISVTMEKGIPLSSKILDRLGRVSYGLYMFHPIIIFLVFAIVRSMNIEDLVVYNLALYTGVFSVTILVSFLSYHTMEKFFLRQKRRFETIASGNRD